MNSTIREPVEGIEVIPHGKTCGGYIAQALHAYGVTHVFFVDAILRRTLVAMESLGIKRILTHSEKAASYMADGYARIAKRPGVCMAQSVGAANLASGLQDAYLGLSPVIALTGRHTAVNQYRNAYQEVPHDLLFAAITKSHAKVELPQQLPHLLRKAFREATTGSPGPVHLDIAGHTGEALAGLPFDHPIDADLLYASFPPHRMQPDRHLLRAATSLLDNADRPVLIGDRGAAISGAGDAMVTLAERLDCHFVLTLDAKDLSVDQHPRFGGFVGTYGRSCANRIVASADVVVFVGSNTSDMTTAGWTMPAQRTSIIQIDVDAAELGRNYPGTVGIQADPRNALESLASEVKQANRSRWFDQATGWVNEWKIEADRQRSNGEVPIRPERLCRELTQVLPSNAILVSDTGYSAQWSGSYIELRHNTQSYIRAAGSLGWAFPASLGAKCAAPDRPVVCFTGDGAFYYHLAELETARRYGINTITVVNNNRCLAQGLRNINAAYEGHSGNKEEIFGFRDTDFAKIATSMDCFGIVVDKPEGFAGAFDAALKSNVPAVIDVRTEFGAQAPSVWIPG